MSNPRPPYDVDYHGERTITTQQELDHWIAKTTNVHSTHNGGQIRHRDRPLVGGEQISDLYVWTEGTEPDAL